MYFVKSVYEECIKACRECLEACNHCFDKCLMEEDAGMMAECIRLDRECAEMCGFALQAMTRNSPYAEDICQLCAKVCEACGNECSLHKHDHCQLCAESCFACAEACKKIAS
ncbi:four-helix bundle copper-binding protein [Bacillus paralicheniformis]|nr:four-helix bundle copper-binding protein [Bacillus paralicheniformis]MBX9433214.1 four-helix bundle copper-binding protein [Bacillus paralicheniformis]MBZ5215857.1 four-helix bundle copper-binding protein [Bacillus paralicheniformis]PAE02704.1 four-helix bundle copper-binding protein [Bacillus paralicheniformis]